MNDLETTFSLANLRRAYKWILSNPDARYKNLFRDSYSAYALASDSNLRRLRQDLLSGHYEASHASKLFFAQARVRGHWADALKLPGFSEGCGGRIPGVCLCGSGVGDRIGDREDLLGY
jgi:hypothetical protein